MRRIVRLLAATGITGVVLVGGGGVASAHVHGFTPLGCLTTDAAQAGATVGFERADDHAAPLQGPTGLIPLNASGKRPTGGQGAEHACG